MALIVPDSHITLYSGIPIDNGWNIAFSSGQKQQDYFRSKILVTRADLSYCRRTGWIRVEYSPSTVMSANYMSFRNPSFENVTFFARIVDFEYINNSTTEIRYTIDWWQTFMFSAAFKNCSILREHLSNSDFDLAVANPYRLDIPELLTDEGLPVGKEFEKNYTETDMLTVPANTPFIEGSNITPFTPAIVLMLSPCNLQSLDDDAVNSFFNLFTGIDGLRRVTTGTGASTYEWGTYSSNFIRPFATCVVVEGGVVPGTTTPLTTEAMVKNIAAAIDWLTLQGLSSAIIGIYQLPYYMVYLDHLGIGGTNYSNWQKTTIDMTPDGTLDNPKLYTAPYSYIRLTSPDGNVKEYMPSKFTGLANGTTNVVSMTMWSNLNGLPLISVTPNEYVYDEIETDIGTNITRPCNMEERIDYSNFPQAGYANDAYLTFLSSQYQNAYRNLTYSKITGAITGGVEAAGGLTTTTAEEVSTPYVTKYSANPKIKTATSTLTNTSINPMALANFGARAIGAGAMAGEMAYMRTTTPDEASAFAGGYPTSGLFNFSRPGYVVDNYHAGAGNGYLQYQLYRQFFLLQKVQLLPAVLENYDRYLSLFGYKSIRTGIPRICNFVSGENSGNLTPKFMTVDGTESTYILTEDFRVETPIKVASDAIATMFNSGCHFINGDDL